MPSVAHIRAALEELQPGLSERIARYNSHSLLEAGIQDIQDIQIASRESLIAGGVHPIAADHILAAQGKCQGRQLYNTLSSWRRYIDALSSSFLLAVGTVPFSHLTVLRILLYCLATCLTTACSSCDVIILLPQQNLTHSMVSFPCLKWVCRDVHSG